MAGRTLLLTVASFISMSSAASIATWDDTDPRITYSDPSGTDGWNNQDCSGCTAKPPDPSDAFDGTWHDNTRFNGLPPFVTVVFNGIGINAFGITVGTLLPDPQIKNVDLSITLDGANVPGFQYNPSPSNLDYQFNVPLYSSPTLDNGQHTLIMTLNPNSMVLVDYFEIVSQDPPPPPPNSNSPPTTSPSLPAPSQNPVQQSSRSAASSTPFNSITTSLPRSTISGTTNAVTDSNSAVTVTKVSSFTTTSTPSSTPALSNATAINSKQLSSGIIVGISIGTLLIIIIFFSALYFFRRRRAKRAREKEQAAEPYWENVATIAIGGTPHTSSSAPRDSRGSSMKPMMRIGKGWLATSAAAEPLLEERQLSSTSPYSGILQPNASPLELPDRVGTHARPLPLIPGKGTQGLKPAIARRPPKQHVDSGVRYEVDKESDSDSEGDGKAVGTGMSDEIPPIYTRR